MKKLTKVLALILLALTVFTSLAVPAFALSWDGSSEGGGGHGTDAGPNGYAISNLTASDDSGPAGIFASKMNQIKRPGQKFYHTDAALYTASVAGEATNKVLKMDGYTNFQKQTWPFRPQGTCHVEFRHRAKANWVYFDGHCGAKALGDFLPNTETTPASVYRYMYPKADNK